MKSLRVAILVALVVQGPAWANDVSDPLAAVVAKAATKVTFTPGVPLLTAESRRQLTALLPQSRSPACYWLARGRTEAEAQALRSALGEFDIAVETVALAVSPQAASAEARIYCTPPPEVTAHFAMGSATLTGETERELSLVAASYWNTNQALVIRGYASRDEASEALMLGLDRAQAARNFLIARGLEPKRLAIEVDTRKTGADGARIVIVAR